MDHFPTFLAVLALALAHISVSHVRFLDGPKGYIWQSIAGGASVSYVFVYILPSLARKQIVLEKTAYFEFFARYRAYLLCLGGFLVYYGIRRLTTLPGFGRKTRNWSLLVGFSLYSMLLGYLLGETDDPGIGFLVLVTAGMSLHFIGTDQGFRGHDRQFYDRTMRWSLAGSILLGWGLGSAHLLGHASVAAWMAFLSGAIIINTLWEEVPDERSVRFWPFLAGAAGFTLLVLLVYSLGQY